MPSVKRLGFLVGFLLWLTTGDTLARHSADFSWMGYCCGQRDCTQATVSIVQFGKVDTTVLVNDTVLVLPSGSVKESEDGHTYWCRFHDTDTIVRENTRCVFYTLGG